MTERVADVISQLDDTARVLRDVRNGVMKALARAHSDTDGGFKPSSLGGGGSPTNLTDEEGVPCDVNDRSVGERVANAVDKGKVDTVADRARELLDDLDACNRHAHAAIAAVNFLRALDPEHARKLAESLVGAIASCYNCGRLVAGTRDDRLRAGRCDACFKFRQRNHKERPKELWEGDGAVRA